MTFRLLSVVALLSAAVALGATNGIHSILKPNRLRVSDVDSPCIIQASVRAEDLSPGHISQGELRVKVSRPDCAHEVVSVVLRLQLTEFGEFVSLKEGVVLPDQWQIVLNHTTAAATTVHDIVYDYQPYAEAISDPELWNVQAQERRAWTTETTLLDRKPDLTHPTVTPFTVAVPNVNYPPGADRGRIVRVARHAFGDLGYQYTAIATFADGRIIAVPAGYTTFVPTDLASPTMTPSSWNITFVNHCEGWTQDLDRCLPKDQRSEFVAEVKLEHGNIVQKGHPMKGRVTIHSTNGSTTMSEVSVGVFTAYRDHWAQAQAASKGDTLFHHDTSPVRQACRTSTSGQPLDAESALYAHIFASEDIVPRSHFPPATLVSSSDADGTALTSTRPYFDFEFEIPIDKPVDFEGLYSATENQLMFVLDVLYASEVADCMKIPPPAAPRTAADVAAAVEETLWASHMRVGHPPNSTTSNALPKWKSRRCVMTLKAMLPITVVRGGTQTILPPPAHYLTPGLPAPVIRPGAHVVPVAPDFPIADPMFTDEPVADTIERLLEPHRGSSRYTGPRFPNSAMAIPDPARHYRQGQYAGVLWKKKIVAEERGFLPFHPEDVDPIGDERQQPFKV